jgi:hypothetical protein
MWRGVFVLALVLAGCSVSEVSGVFDKPAESNPAGAPPYRQIISQRLGEVFASTAEPRDVQISEARPAKLPSGAAWRVCLRATLTGITGQSTGPLTYVVFVTRDGIADRRLAVADDQCQQESFQRL